MLLYESYLIDLYKIYFSFLYFVFDLFNVSEILTIA